MYIHEESRCNAIFKVIIYGHKHLIEVIGKDKEDCINICEKKYNGCIIELVDYEIEWLY